MESDSFHRKSAFWQKSKAKILYLTLLLIYYVFSYSAYQNKKS